MHDNHTPTINSNRIFIRKRVLSIGLKNKGLFIRWFDGIQAGFYMRIHKMAFEPLVRNNLLIQAGKEGEQV
jgi:hypothetical protein